LSLGLTTGSYEAYCLDQAVWYLGTQISHQLEEVGRKKEKGEAGKEAQRKAVLEKIFGGKTATAYADPAALFEARQK
jgi:hypothetical protein